MEKEIVFEVRGVTKVYDMGLVQVHALRGVDLDLYAGELVAMLGASGSGKSTLLNIIGGLDTATSGSVIYKGRDITRAPRSTPRARSKCMRCAVSISKSGPGKSSSCWALRAAASRRC